MGEMKIVRVFVADDNLQAEMILEALKENGVPALKQDMGAGGIMNLYGGNSHCGEEIYVTEDNRRRAVEVLAVMGLGT